MAEEFEFRLHISGLDTSRVFPVPQGTTIIGRQPGTDLLLEHPEVSRRHAQLVCTAADCHIVDLASSNGTRVDGVALAAHVPVPLTHGLAIRIGPFELVVEQVALQPEPDPELPLPPAPGDWHLVEPGPEPPPPPLPVEAVAPEPVPEPPVPEIPVEPRAPEPASTPAEPPPAPQPVVQVAAAFAGLRVEPAPPIQPPPAAPPPSPEPGGDDLVPPGLDLRSRRLLGYLPGAYHTDFMARFLGIFESILSPVEWTVDNWDLYLDPGTAPAGFLPWLANWFGVADDPTWNEAQRRTLLAEAHRIYARRGTCWALARVLEIYTGQAVQIVDNGSDQEPFTFRVRLPVPSGAFDRQSIERIVDANKPAYTTYTVEFRP